MANLIQIGIFLIVVGLILVFISTITTERSNLKGGGIIFLGPIPIFGAASDKKIIYLLFAIGIVLFIIFYFLRKFI